MKTDRLWIGSIVMLLCSMLYAQDIAGDWQEHSGPALRNSA
jgi:hypothetical protein